jgi:hypothetical protein
MFFGRTFGNFLAESGAQQYVYDNQRRVLSCPIRIHSWKHLRNNDVRWKTTGGRNKNKDYALKTIYLKDMMLR